MMDEHPVFRSTGFIRSELKPLGHSKSKAVKLSTEGDRWQNVMTKNASSMEMSVYAEKPEWVE